jgi:predicted ATP-dependent serine protease
MRGTARPPSPQLPGTYVCRRCGITRPRNGGRNHLGVCIDCRAWTKEPK